MKLPDLEILYNIFESGRLWLSAPKICDEKRKLNIAQIVMFMQYSV